MAPPLSVDFLTEFIEIYRSYPCLWKIKSSEYSNKHLRDGAYKKLIEFCKTVVPDANKEFVTKKISSLRGAFRKELKKVKDCNHSGMGADESYTPKLWYYNLLMFTADQEEIRQAIDNTEDAEEENQDDDSTSIIDVQDDETDLEVSQASSQSSIRPPHKLVKTNKTPTPPLRARNDGKSKVKNDFYTKALDTLSKTEDEFDHFGMCTAAKLRRMDPQQRIHCENLINMAIYKGTLGHLHENYTVQSWTTTPQTQHGILPSNYFPVAPQTSNVPISTSTPIFHLPPSAQPSEYSSYTRLSSPQPTVTPGFIPLRNFGGSTFRINDALNVSNNDSDA